MTTSEAESAEIDQSTTKKTPISYDLRCHWCTATHIADINCRCLKFEEVREACEAPWCPAKDREDDYGRL